MHCYKKVQVWSTSTNMIDAISVYHLILTWGGPKSDVSQLKVHIMHLLERFAIAIVQLHHFRLQTRDLHAGDIVSSTPIVEPSL